MVFIPPKGLLRVLCGPDRPFPPASFGGPRATRSESTIRDGLRFCIVAAVLVDCHDGLSSVASDRTSQKGHSDGEEDNMLGVSWASHATTNFLRFEKTR